MKFLAVLGALAIQCAATKSWNSDSYPEETFSIFGWIGYLKRLSLIVLMLAGVIMYYVPESRPHVRRICYALIDLTANSLKFALSARENEHLYEKIKSKYHRARYDQSLITRKRRSREDQESIEGSERVYSARGKRSKAFIVDDGLLGERERRKTNGKHDKDRRQSRHRLRGNVIKEILPQSCTEDEKSVFVYSDKLEDLQKYVKTNYDVKRASGSSVENYALLISGSPQQMAMLDQKYEKNDVVIVEDPYLRVEYKDCGTSTDKLSSKTDISGSEQEGPTRDRNDRRVETYVKDVDLSFPPEDDTRYSEYRPSYKMNQYHCGGECCGGNGCSISYGDLNIGKEVFDTVSSNDTKNVLKISRSMVSPNMRTTLDENNENLYTAVYNDYACKTRTKSSNLSNDRKGNFLNGEKGVSRKREVPVSEHEHTSRGVRKQKSRHSNLSTEYCCNDTYYYTDRGGEADDENSLHGRRVTAKHNLDERPQKENYVFDTNSDDSIFGYEYKELATKPILKNGLKPVLLRAVNWIFGGCPAATKRSALKYGDVGKEEIQGFGDEWLL
ncbi:uncharacterized protein LOC143147929 [Ptiloglossa arizonensis]|uniref:uncharacterized protein LOC143147929 n=1 Tax=Ptiloglossa arizonensis TaxID=3350558 RepID=UPI003F9FD8C1